MITMQLEELQQQWQRLDEKLERTLTLDRELLRMAMTQRTRRRLNRLAFWPAVDIAFSVAILLLGGSFLGNHWGTWPLVLPATVVMLAAIALLGSSTGQLIRVAEIDWSGTVVDI